MSDDIFLQFLETLPVRDRKLYLLITAYRKMLNEFTGADTSSISTFFQAEINKLAETSNSPIYETHRKRDERAEKSASKPVKADRFKAVRETDRQLDDKLGKWASSFSDDEEDNDKDLEKRLDDSSDLSSHDDDERGIPIVVETSILAEMLNSQESTVQIISPADAVQEAVQIISPADAVPGV